jgi:plasmid stabilization system protein ParE
MKVVVTEAAWDDLLRIGRIIQQESPARAQTFVDELYDRCRELANMPRRFPVPPGRTNTGVRRRVHGNYLIFYRIVGDIVEVLHVVHGAMDYEKLLFPEG